MASDLQLNAHRLSVENHNSSFFQLSTVCPFLNFDFLVAVKDELLISLDRTKIDIEFLFRKKNKINKGLIWHVISEEALL